MLLRFTLHCERVLQDFLWKRLSAKHDYEMKPLDEKSENVNVNLGSNVHSLYKLHYVISFLICEMGIIVWQPTLLDCPENQVRYTH